MIKQHIRPTQLVRSVMRSFGRQSYEIWTNKYQHCRTVKCYTRAGEDYVSLFKEIRAALLAAGVNDFSIKHYKDANSFYHPLTSLIVRIPNTEQK